MSSKYTQSKEELQQHLKDAIQALELSVRSFDEGYEGEGKRLAATIRVLLHDTISSQSLLGQLEQKTIPFYDASMPRAPKIITTYNGLAAINSTPQGATKYIALLDDLPPDNPPRWTSFDDWWNMVVFIDKNGSETSRKDLILAVANKDGGAHVNPVLGEKYANLSRGNSLAWRYHGPKGDVPLKGPEKAAVRQIAHEVIKSLNPAMPNRKPKMEGIIFPGNIMATTKPPQIRKVGRNDPCPCGSGKKYKRCHGK